MNIIDIIEKKRDKFTLTKEEINFFINGYVNDEIKDYQASSLLMAILLNGMNDQETTDLTMAMVNSGDIVDLSSIAGIKCDKHSTGGVGDKVTLVLAPLLASCGVKVAKMSGRGLSHTGGTLDKLESIKNFNVNLSIDQFIKQVNSINIAIIAQSSNLAYADKKLYALRDVNGSVPSIPLIASSIMSKKIASGADAIVLDVKIGNGAFMKDIESATKLANTMVNIGKLMNKDVKAIISDMNTPLGYAIGNSLEVIEAINTLQNKGPQDLVDVCIELGIIMMLQSNIYQDENLARKKLIENLENNKAFDKFVEFAQAQNGDISCIYDFSKFKQSKFKYEIKSNKTGYLTSINALEIGKLSLELGAGRHTKDDVIDPSAGILFNVKVNDYIKEDDIIATLYTDKEDKDDYINLFHKSIVIEEKALLDYKLIKKIIV